MLMLGKTVVQILGYLFTILVLGFTGYQTYSLLLEVSGNPMIAALGLALFEGGMLYWLAAFKNDAEGIMQMALSLLLFLFGLLLVGGSTALHLGAMDAQSLGENTPAKLITIAALVNLVGKTLYPIFSPDTFANIWTRALEGVVITKAYVAAQGKADDLAQNLADNLGNEIVRRLTVSVMTGHQLNHEAGRTELPAIEAKTSVIAAAGEPAPTLRQRNSRSIAPINHHPQAQAQPQRKTEPIDIYRTQETAATTPRYRVIVENPYTQEQLHDLPAETYEQVESILEKHKPTLRIVSMWKDTGYEAIGRYHPFSFPGTKLKPFEVTHLRDGGDIRRFNYSTLHEAKSAAANALNQPGVQMVLIEENGQVVERLDGKAVSKPSRPQWELNDLLDKMGMTADQARETARRYNLTSPPAAWNRLKAFGYIPDGMEKDDFLRLYNELMSGDSGRGGTETQDNPLPAPAQ